EGYQPGGQLTLTPMVENFPGVPDGIMGADLRAAMRQQAARFGAEFVSGQATAVDLSGQPLKVTVDEKTTYETRALIIATGASAKMLGLPNVRYLIGRVVSTCPACECFISRNNRPAVPGTVP